MAGLATFKAIVHHLLLRCLEWLLLLLHLVFLDGLIEPLEVTTKGLMNHHLICLLIALSAPLSSVHQLGIVYLELLIFLQKVSLKSRHIPQEEVQDMVSKSNHEVEASTFAKQV